MKNIKLNLEVSAHGYWAAGNDIVCVIVKEDRVQVVFLMFQGATVIVHAINTYLSRCKHDVYQHKGKRINRATFSMTDSVKSKNFPVSFIAK